ncbi:glycosyltransferase family protein [Methylobacter sp.]|uniref:glycosyltransferase family protein n=1 Tax=Methylobacter sp. TaxID=2051955 RepID=UPI002FDCCC6C
MTKMWRVLLLDTKKSNPNHYICLAIKEAFEAHPQTEKIVKADYGNAITRALANNCNLFVAFDGEEVERGICARLATLCGTSLLWVTEDPYENSINQVNADLFDLIFTNNSSSVNTYGQKGRHLPFAASPYIHFHETRFEQNDDFLYDLFFVGTAWPNRVEFIKRLQSSLAGLKVKIALPYNPHIPAPKLNMAPSAYLWKTPNSEFAKFSNRSRVTLTLHRDFSASGNISAAQTPGPRLFEVALAGGFQLIDMSLPEVTEYFDEDTQFAGFHTPEECIEKLKFFLSNPDKRIAIAKAAQERALNAHLYSHRIDTIYSEVAKLDKPKQSHIHNQRPNVLFVTHNILNVQPYGGVEVYQQEIINSLKERFRFFVYSVDRTALPLGKKYTLYDEDMAVIQSHNFDNDIDDTVLSCPNRERKFSEILSLLEIDLVHFQHLIGHVPSLPFITKALGIPSVASLHDYYAICRHFNLIGYQGGYCNVTALPPVSCDICLNAMDNAATGSQAVRRAFFGRVLEQVDVLHANTDSVAALFKAMFPNLRLSNQLQIYGIPMPADSAVDPIKNHVRSSDPIHIAIIGNFTKNKGADVLIHALNQMRDDPVQFHVFGTVTEPYATLFGRLAYPNVKIHGEFQAGSIVDRLKATSLSLHLSIWPETYCITLSEAWRAGVVPIVSDIGALGERVTHDINGFKVPIGEPGAVVDILRQLIAQPDRIEKIRSQINPGLFASNEGHMSWLEGLYGKLLQDFYLVNASTKKHLSGSGLSLSDCGIVLNRNTWFKHNNDRQAQTVISNQPQKLESLLHKLFLYKRNHGTKKTALRVIYGIKIALYRTAKRKIL